MTPIEAAGEAKKAASRAARKARKALGQARKKREKICAWCKQAFLLRSDFDPYCYRKHKKESYLARRKA